MEWDSVLAFFGKVTPGTPALHVLVVMGLAFWWKGLPTVIEAIASRQSKIEERMGALLTSATERFEIQIQAADRRHSECMEGQEKLRTRIVALEHEVDQLREENAGMRRARVAVQVSAIRSAPDGVSAEIDNMMEQLARLPGQNDS